LKIIGRQECWSTLAATNSLLMVLNYHRWSRKDYHRWGRKEYQLRAPIPAYFMEDL